MAYDDIKKGEGKVFREEHLAVCRDEAGKLWRLDSRCTHGDCDVKWNAEDKTWDCPCHGARFTHDGHIKSEPAFRPLKLRE